MAETGWLTIAKIGLNRAVGFLPNWILKKAYPPAKMKELILIYSTGGTSGGPQLYVTPGRLLAVETNEVVVVNLLPFSVDLENIHVELLLGGMSLGSKEIIVSRPIGRMKVELVNLRFELSDNQAAMARNYEGPPVLQMGMTANFRTHRGLIPLRYDIRIQAIIYK